MIEVLAVIVIIALLMAIAIPAIQHTRETARPPLLVHGLGADDILNGGEILPEFDCRWHPPLFA